MDKGEFYADNAHEDLRIAMNTLRTIPKMVHSTVFENDNPENIDVVAAIVEKGLAWVERAIQELATGWPDTVDYKPYGFCEVASAVEGEAQNEPTSLEIIRDCLGDLRSAVDSVACNTKAHEKAPENPFRDTPEA
jgi:hypothetical protein